MNDEQLPAPRKRGRVRNILAAAAAAVVVGALIAVATTALLRNATLPSQLTAADARAANAVTAAQAAAKSDYAARNAALDQEAATLKQQSQVIAAETGELRASAIHTDGEYVVGHDIKPGTWHTVGDGGASGGRCVFVVLSSANKYSVPPMYFDGPWTVNLSRAYAFRSRGPVPGCASHSDGRGAPRALHSFSQRGAHAVRPYGVCLRRGGRYADTGPARLTAMLSNIPPAPISMSSGAAPRASTNSERSEGMVKCSGSMRESAWRWYGCGNGNRIASGALAHPHPETTTEKHDPHDSHSPRMTLQAQDWVNSTSAPEDPVRSGPDTKAVTSPGSVIFGTFSGAIRAPCRPTPRRSGWSITLSRHFPPARSGIRATAVFRVRLLTWLQAHSRASRKFCAFWARSRLIR